MTNTVRDPESLTPTEMRQGIRHRYLSVVLGVSTVLAIIALAVTYAVV